MPEAKILRHFANDHDQLMVFFRIFQENKNRDFPRAKEFFKKFKICLQRHIVWEEEILFPLFEKKTGAIHAGPTVEMREEHRLIEEKLEILHKRIQKNDSNSDTQEQALLHILHEHNEREKLSFYPALNRIISEADKINIFFRMNKMPEEKFKISCHSKQ